MCHCEDNPATCMSRQKRKARKDHRCYECGDTIVKGDLYLVISGVWDGTAADYKLCHSCATIEALAWSAFGDEFCYTIGELIECVEEIFREDERWPGVAA